MNKKESLRQTCKLIVIVHVHVTLQVCVCVRGGGVTYNRMLKDRWPLTLAGVTRAVIIKAPLSLAGVTRAVIFIAPLSLAGVTRAVIIKAPPPPLSLAGVTRAAIIIAPPPLTCRGHKGCNNQSTPSQLQGSQNIHSPPLLTIAGVTRAPSGPWRSTPTGCTAAAATAPSSSGTSQTSGEAASRLCPPTETA